MESIYNVAGSLLTTYLDELSAVQDARTLTTFELIALERERNLRPRLSISRERLEAHQRLSMPSGRL